MLDVCFVGEKGGNLRGKTSTINCLKWAGVGEVVKMAVGRAKRFKQGPDSAQVHRLSCSCLSQNFLNLA